MRQDRKEKQSRSNEVATHTYDPSNDTFHHEAAKALAKTHEQVNDVYTEGTIDIKVEEDELDK